MLPTLSFLTGSEFLTPQIFFGSIRCKNVKSLLSLIIAVGRSNPKETTRRARFHHRLLMSMLSAFFDTFAKVTPRVAWCDTYHSRTRVICYRVSTALAYIFRRALESQAKRCFHTCHTTSGCTDQHIAHSHRTPLKWPNQALRSKLWIGVLRSKPRRTHVCDRSTVNQQIRPNVGATIRNTCVRRKNPRGMRFGQCLRFLLQEVVWPSGT